VVALQEKWGNVLKDKNLPSEYRGNSSTNHSIIEY